MATCYKRLSFSNEEEFKLIEFIKKHPALWDPSHGEYGNSELRKLYWISLATELNKSVFECRRKWRFVRDYYIHRRRRQPESTPQRDGKYFSLQFLNKIKVSSKKFKQNNDHEQSHELVQRNIKSKNNVTNNAIEKIEVDFVDSDEEIDYDFLDDPTFEKITVERMGNDQKYITTSNNTDVDECLQHQDPDNNDDKSDDFLFKEDYEDEESSVAGDYAKVQNVEEVEGGGGEEAEEEEEHIMTEENKVDNITFGQGTTQTESTATTLFHEKAIDLFFESMAAAVKTFPPQYVAEAKCKVFMAFNEVESKVYKSANTN